MKKQLKIRNNA